MPSAPTIRLNNGVRFRAWVSACIKRSEGRRPSVRCGRRCASAIVTSTPPGSTATSRTSARPFGPVALPATRCSSRRSCGTTIRASTRPCGRSRSAWPAWASITSTSTCCIGRYREAAGVVASTGAAVRGGARAGHRRQQFHAPSSRGVALRGPGRSGGESESSSPRSSSNGTCAPCVRSVASPSRPTARWSGQRASGTPSSWTSLAASGSRRRRCCCAGGCSTI